MSDLVLPFKPFTLGEVQSIADVKPVVLDAWIGDELLSLHIGDDGFTRGLNDSQLFGVFYAAKFLKEGADLGTATEILKFVTGTGLQVVKQMSRAAEPQMPYVMPGDNGPMPCWVPAPLKLRLGRMLHCAIVIREFEDRLSRVFTK